VNYEVTQKRTKCGTVKVNAGWQMTTNMWSTDLQGYFDGALRWPSDVVPTKRDGMTDQEEGKETERS
jgi:hypothetical protein